MNTADALLVIDYTNDFVADKGSLTCGKPGQTIDSFIAKRAQSYLESDKFVFFPTDLHQKGDPYHPETKLFPPHNLANTWGRELYGKTGQWYQAHQDSNHVLFFDKNFYNAFNGTNLNALLRWRNLSSIELVGVCTDICILHSAIGAYDLGYKIQIPEAGVATFNPAGQNWALNHFKTVLGAKVF